ncbi:MAG: hypothetical protein QXI58_00710 [Candidatus Micrarchaeia archaeon]
MPNWCFNELEINCMGKTEKLKELKKLVATKNSAFSFTKIVPYPKEFKILDEINGFDLLNEAERQKKKERLFKKYAQELERIKSLGLDINKDGYNQGGYDWCLENWGTKWDACNVELIIDDDYYLFYRFETAWSPPIPIIIELSKKFPDLWFQLRFFERGMGFCGIINVRNGEIEEKVELSYYGTHGG